jgi:thiol-disulfide isomerase/thioredoxin
MPGKTRKSKSSSRSVMGKLLPPVDVTSPSQLNELDKRISIGPITLVMIYADWCGHCTRFKPMMKELENSAGRSVQVARVRDNVLPQSALANIPNEGYPSLMLIKKDGTAATFLDKEGNKTNVVPEHTDMAKMESIVRNAGTPEGVSLLNSEQPANVVQEMSNPSASGFSAPPSVSASGIPKNIVADRLSQASVVQLNNRLANSRNSLVQQSTQQGGGGGLWSYLLSNSQRVAPAAALLFASTLLNKKKTRKSRKSRKTRG